MALGIMEPARADYDFTKIDVPDATATFANGVNDTGQVVGIYGDAGDRGHGFLLSEGEFTTIDVPCSTRTSAQSIKDYIVENGGTITEAVSSQVWSGEAAVHVSIVNWLKGTEPGVRRIFTQHGDDPNSPWKVDEVEKIPSALTAQCDVTSAVHIQVNRDPKVCLEGQQPGHRGFCIDGKKLKEIMRADSEWRSVIWPFLNGDDFLSGHYKTEPEYVIDLGARDMLEAKKHALIFAHLHSTVLPDWVRNAEAEKKRTGKTTGEHQNRLQHWWLLKRRRGELILGIEKLSRYIICSAVTKRPIFEFISSTVRPSNALKAFLFEDNYSFGVLQSSTHWAWFTARCSTLKGDFRYTPDTVFDTFPWPQSPKLDNVQKVAAAAVALRSLRQKVTAVNGWSLRDLYRTLEMPGENPLRDSHTALDAAVRAVYGMKARDDQLAFLLALNQRVAEREVKGEQVVAPGLPACAKEVKGLVTEDCVRVE